MSRKGLVCLLVCLACAGARAQMFPEERDGLNALLGQVESSLTSQDRPTQAAP